MIAKQRQKLHAACREARKRVSRMTSEERARLLALGMEIVSQKP